MIDEEQMFQKIDDPALRPTLAEQSSALEGRKGGLLQAVSADGGEPLAEFRLEAPPVFDGMAAAGGRLYMATTDGQVLCFRGEQ